MRSETPPSRVHGFTLENPFASFLIACEHEAYNDYKKNDLDKALKASRQYGLVLAPENVEFVTLLAPYMIDDLDISDLRKGPRAVRTIIEDVEVFLAVMSTESNDRREPR